MLRKTEKLTSGDVVGRTLLRTLAILIMMLRLPC
jgi:hypothetical protein